MRIPGLVLAVLAITGCYGSHELGGSASPRDGGSGSPLACGEHLFLLGNWDLPRSEGEHARGLDIDGIISTGAGSSCVDRTRDFFSSLDDEPGIDNALSLLVPQIEMLDGRPIRETLGSAVDEGRFVHAIELVDLDDTRNDPEVAIILHVATVIGGIRAEGGRVEADQRLELRPLARGNGLIVDGRFRGELEDFVLELSDPGADTLLLPLTIRDASIAFYVSCDGTPALHRAALAGMVTVDDLTAQVERLMPGIGDTVRSVLVELTDMSPAPDDPATCEGISLAYTFEGTAARR